MENIGSRIRQARKSKKLTIAQMAFRSNMSCGNISEIERDIYLPSFDKLQSLSKVLECDINWILTGRTSFSSEEMQILQLFSSLHSDIQKELLRLLEYEVYRNSG